MTWMSCRVPTRVDLAGGTLDISPLPRLLSNPTTINLGVGLYATARGRVIKGSKFIVASKDQKVKLTGTMKDLVETSELPIVGLILKHCWEPSWSAIEIELEAMCPRGAGLGGSSAICIALLGLLSNLRESEGYAGLFSSDQEHASLAQDIEAELIRVPTGCQDYWGAVKGGANILKYPPGKVELTHLSEFEMSGLTQQMFLWYSGVSRASAVNNWDIFREFFDGNEAVQCGLQEVATCARQTAEAFLEKNWLRVIEASEREWQVRLGLWPMIETPETQKIDCVAKEEGAYFSRVCGAGGGGVMLVFCPQEHQQQVISRLKEIGGFHLDVPIGVGGISYSK